MSERYDTDVDRLSAPDGDGGLLVWPDVESIPRIIEHNRTLRAQRALRLLGRTWPERPDGPVVVMAGHQPEFFHPGVWIKNMTAVRLARRLDGVAVCLLVDSDMAGDLVLRWPQRVNGHWTVRQAVAPITPRNVAFEQAAVTPASEWRRFFDQVSWPGDSVFENFKAAFGQDEGEDYVSHWERGIRAVDAACGEGSPQFTRVSRVFSGDSPGIDPFVFLGHVISEARAFAAVYNSALKQYRARRGIRGNERPIPDLRMDGDWIELPFWIWRSTDRRGRLCVRTQASDAIGIGHDGEFVGQVGLDELRRDPRAAISAAMPGHVIRPRALTLTLLTRLAACDLFIHGIGGAKYDQITDSIIREFFGIEPPAYACVSATLRLELTNGFAEAGDVRQAARQLRDVQYNPQRFVDTGQPESGTLLVRRQAAIEASSRLREETPHDRPGRRAAFDQIQRTNHAILEQQPNLLGAARRRFDEARRGYELSRVARDREWFVALHPVQRLKALCAQLPW